MKVDDLWWEGDTLCMESEGRVWRFAGARVTKMETDYGDSEGIQITPVEFVEIKLDE